MDHVKWYGDHSLHSPFMVTAFSGWNDGAEAASMAMQAMIDGWGARLVAAIDAEEFTDFASNRPAIQLTDGVTRMIDWPEVRLWHATTRGEDVLLLSGPEPSLRWRLFCDQVLAIIERCGVEQVVNLGALLADVPHTREVQLIGTATDQVLVDAWQLQRSRYEGPTGIPGVLQDACHRAGISTASLWAATPAYAAQVPSPKAALALAERAVAMVGGGYLPIDELSDAVGDYERRVSDLVDADEDLGRYVRRLEEIVDEDEGFFANADADDDNDDDNDDAIGGESAGDESGEQLIEELERYLRDQSDPG